MKIIGKAHKLGDLINTDIHCSSKYLPPEALREDVVRNIFTDIKPGFAERIEQGDIIAAGHGFGTVSSREEAPVLLREIGIHAVLAKSFGYLFYRNAINVGLPVIECDTDMIEEYDIVGLDLQEGVVKNLTSNSGIGSSTRYSREIMRILEDGGLINHIKKYGGYAIYR